MVNNKAKQVVTMNSINHSNTCIVIKQLWSIMKYIKNNTCSRILSL